ncbi:hypothetical protein [Pectobacterium aquaticum]|uniref:hypothetical protein n=1 Tax=Pectobacterium aquaticum TaxID=2204145 RepID=UPI000E23605F|nr:hypothetical protein [Pectobacterium aquaticum]RRO10750.1 hypothetical protein DMB81_001810 [Pectobacterium aquaticum]
MIRSDTLLKQLPYFFDSINKSQKITLDNISQNDIKLLIPYLLEHKLEYLSFLSINETKSLEHFYEFTLKKQIECLTTLINNELIDCQAIFLQGFPRCLGLSNIAPFGMRTDIDIHIPPENIVRFKRDIKKKGFDEFGFSDTEIFLVDDEIKKNFTVQSWAQKDFTLTLPLQTDLPKDLPIDFGDCYLPWLYRGEKWFLMVSLEIHHSYIDESDYETIFNNTERWPETGFSRSNLPSLIYFNLVRLYQGVFSGEKRLRLLLDTACLFKQSEITSCITDVDNLIKKSPLAFELRSLCLCLSNMHMVFSPLREISYLNNSFNDWLNTFHKSLYLNIAGL